MVFAIQYPNLSSYPESIRLLWDAPAMTLPLDLRQMTTYALLVLTGKGYDHMDATVQSRWMTLREVTGDLQLS